MVDCLANEIVAFGAGVDVVEYEILDVFYLSD
jgi:hypothetical protein